MQSFIKTNHFDVLWQNLPKESIWGTEFTKVIVKFRMSPLDIHLCIELIKTKHIESLGTNFDQKRYFWDGIPLCLKFHWKQLLLLNTTMCQVLLKTKYFEVSEPHLTKEGVLGTKAKVILLWSYTTLFWVNI